MVRATVAAMAVLAAACSSGGGPTIGDRAGIDECSWPMWGGGPARSFSSGCPSELGVDTVGALTEAWFFNAADAVTATPAVVDDTVYVGDWSGRFYALDGSDGQPRWTFQAEVHPGVYTGQIVSSAAVADVGGDRLVYFGGGKTVYALDASDGSVRWAHQIGANDAEDPTEIESSPVVSDGRVIIGYDAHNAPLAAGLLALDAASGEVLWDFDPDLGAEPTGCVDIWGSPTVDESRGLVFAGTGNCPSSPDGWGPYTEALFALDVETGEPAWSFQPHEPNNDDLDFAGAPNLFRAGDRDLVGLGNKDAAYYAVDRDTGELVWSTQATEPGIDEPGTNFSTGGFIGPTAVADGLIVGGTGAGPCPCLHALDAATGEIAWQSEQPASTFAAAAEVNGVVFIGASDFTLRAFDLDTGAVLWSTPLAAPIAGGAAVVGDDLFAVAGLREPGTDGSSENAGVYRFSLGDGNETPTNDTAPARGGDSGIVGFDPATAPCVDAACPMEFGLNEAPAGPEPRFELRIQPDPLQISVEAVNAGDPADWIRPGSEAEAAGASIFGLLISAADDDPFGAGGLICSFGPDETGCTGDQIPRFAPTFNRISLAALSSATAPLTVADGADRLVRTISFNPPLRSVTK